MGKLSITGVAVLAVFLLALASLAAYSGADTLASATKLWDRLLANQDALFSLDREDISFTEVKFTLRAMTENVEIELDVLTDNDTAIESPAPGEVYQYVRAVSTNIQPANLDNARIRFRVNKTWISGENINKDNLTLQVYGTSWSGLATSLIREDGEHYYYESPLERFLLFAVSGEKEAGELLCSPGGTKCVENDLYQCSPDGMSWGLSENCAYGCEEGACRAGECPDAGVCSPGEQKCSGNSLQACNSEGTGWEFVSNCPNGCALCSGGQTDTDPLFVAIIIYQVVIVLLVVILVALVLQLRANK